MRRRTLLQSFNLWDEGDYRVYGLAALAPDGSYWPAYLIERIRGIPNAPQQAAALSQVEVESYMTEELAKKAAVSLAVARVQNQDRLAC